jgi:hypothetical protein
MAFIDNMEQYSDKDRPFLTLRETTITFSKRAVEMLEFSPYVHMYTDKKRCIAAFVPCEAGETAIPFFKDREGKQMLVRVSGKDRIRALMDAGGITDLGKGLRFYGYFIEEEKTLVINMTPSEESK